MLRRNTQSRLMKNVGFVPRLGKSLIDRLRPEPGERILHLGRETGELTKAISSLGRSVSE